MIPIRALLRLGSPVAYSRNAILTGFGLPLLAVGTAWMFLFAVLTFPVPQLAHLQAAVMVLGTVLIPYGTAGFLARARVVARASQSRIPRRKRGVALLRAAPRA